MKLKSILTLAIALPLLSACDLVDKHKEIIASQIADVTIYIPPFFELKIDDGEIGYIHGFEECLGESVNWLFGYSQSVGGKDCIKITPETESIKVRIRNNHVNLIETWNVSRVNDSVSLTRPSGFKVREPANQL